MLTLKAVEGVQESSKVTLEYHVFASSLEITYVMKRNPVMLTALAESNIKLTSLPC